MTFYIARKKRKPPQERQSTATAAQEPVTRRAAPQYQYMNNFSNKSGFDSTSDLLNNNNNNNDMQYNNKYDNYNENDKSTAKLSLFKSHSLTKTNSNLSFENEFSLSTNFGASSSSSNSGSDTFEKYHENPADRTNSLSTADKSRRTTLMSRISSDRVSSQFKNRRSISSGSEKSNASSVLQADSPVKSDSDESGLEKENRNKNNNNFKPIDQKEFNKNLTAFFAEERKKAKAEAEEEKHLARQEAGLDALLDQSKSARMKLFFKGIKVRPSISAEEMNERTIANLKGSQQKIQNATCAFCQGIFLDKGRRGPATKKGARLKMHMLHCRKNAVAQNILGTTTNPKIRQNAADDDNTSESDSNNDFGSDNEDFDCIDVDEDADDDAEPMNVETSKSKKATGTSNSKNEKKKKSSEATTSKNSSKTANKKGSKGKGKGNKDKKGKSSTNDKASKKVRKK